MKQSILGLNFDNLTMEEALEKGAAFLAGGSPAVVVTPNAEIGYDASRDPAFAELLNRADLMLPDGAGVVLAAKLRKTPLKGKVAGIDFAAGMLPVLAEKGASLYLLGSKPGVAEQAAEKMKELSPGLVIAGTADGYFRDEGPVVEKINASGAKALYVCLGSPKQEKFMFDHRDEQTSVRLMEGLGGSLDGFAGNVKRAPEWMIKANLEWFYRLCKQPSRLGRMMRLPKYLFKAVRSKEKTTGEENNG